MKMRKDDMVQRGHASRSWTKSTAFLIDEARTPLIISGPLEDRAELYNAVDRVIRCSPKKEFELDEKQRQVSLNEAGNERVEKCCRSGLMQGSLYDVENITFVHT